MNTTYARPGLSPDVVSVLGMGGNSGLAEFDEPFGGTFHVAAPSSTERNAIRGGDQIKYTQMSGSRH
jgi:hypothetical protein